MAFLSLLRRRLTRLVVDGQVLVRVLRDPRTPAAAKAVAALLLAYAVSPVDVIPDPTLLGILDDLIIFPAGVRVALGLAPDAVVRDARERVGDRDAALRRAKRALLVVGVLWLLTIAVAAALLWRAVA